MSIKYLSVYVLLVGFIACSDNNDPVPEPTVETVLKYEFTGEYDVLDINRYIGPAGEKIDVSTSYLDKYWEFWHEPSSDTIIIDLGKDSLFMKSQYSTIDYKLTLKDDSVFATNRNDYTAFMGILNRSNGLLTHYNTYYVRRFMARPDKGIYGADIFHKGSRYGKGTYADHFYENGFKSPADMTKDGDEILWTNVSYQFRKKQ